MWQRIQIYSATIISMRSRPIWLRSAKLSIPNAIDRHMILCAVCCSHRASIAIHLNRNWDRFAVIIAWIFISHVAIEFRTISKHFSTANVFRNRLARRVVMWNQTASKSFNQRHYRIACVTEFQVCVVYIFFGIRNRRRNNLLLALFHQIVPTCQTNLSARTAIWIVCIVDVAELAFQNHLDVMGNSTAPMA